MLAAQPQFGSAEQAIYDVVRCAVAVVDELGIARAANAVCCRLSYRPGDPDTVTSARAVLVYAVAGDACVSA
jgi:hypothetical protein